MKQIDSKKVLYGAHIGEHGYDLDGLIDDIKRSCISRGMNFVTIRTPRRKPVPGEYLVKWAKFCAENKIYFIYLYTLQHAPEGQLSQYTPEIVKQIKEVAGEYFLGDMLGELGSVWVGKLPGYYINGHPPMLPQNAKDMQAAKDSFIAAVKNYVDIDRSLGIDRVSVVESSLIVSYDLEGGIDLPFAELMGRDPEMVIASIRGSSKAYGAKLWGSYFAHEWYAGRFHDDMLKRKRLFIEYKLAYMNGSGILCHESGDEVVNAYGRHFDYDSVVCTECREFIRDFAEYLNEDDRPEGQPITKLAFVQGNLDSWRGGGGGCFCWGQFEGKEWGYNEPEWSWRILDEVNRKSRWSEGTAYETFGNDATGQVPYGTYDILPASAPVEIMQKYDTLIYAGWNTMTEEQLEKLEKFVENGGTLLISAAHFNSNAKRGGEFIPVRGGDLSRLCGCRLTGETVSYNFGMKFRNESLVEGMRYPTSLSPMSDPGFSEGFIDYAVAEPTDGKVMATIENSFHFVDQPGIPSVIEKKLGQGNVILTLNRCYPGRGSIYSLYRMMVRSLMHLGVLNAKVRVIGPDTLRYTVYEDGSVYMLNTDFDTDYTVTLIDGDRRERIHLDSLEMKHIKLGHRIED